MGHDVTNCPKEDVEVMEKKVEVFVEPKLEVETVVEPESHVEIEEVEEFGNGEVLVEQYVVEEESTMDEVQGVLVEDDSQSCN